jgi:hypothetical protein
MGPTSHCVSFVVAGGEPRNKPVAGTGPVPDVEGESTTSAEMGPVTDAEAESSAETSNTGANTQYLAMNITNV